MEEKNEKGKKGYTRHSSLSVFMRRKFSRRSGSNSLDRGASSTPSTERRLGDSAEQRSHRQRISSETRGGENEVVNPSLASHSPIASSSRERLYNQPEQHYHKNLPLDASSDTVSSSSIPPSGFPPLRDPASSSLLSQRRLSNSTTTSNNSNSITARLQQLKADSLQRSSKTDQDKIAATLEEYRALLKVRATSGGAKFYLNYISHQLEQLEKAQQQNQESGDVYEDTDGNYDLPGPSSSSSLSPTTMAHNGANYMTTSSSPRENNSRFLSVSGGVQQKPGGLVHQRSNESHDSTNSFLSMASMASTSSGAGATVVASNAVSTGEADTSTSPKSDVPESGATEEGPSLWKKALSGIKEKRGSFFKKKKKQQQEIIEVDPVYHLLKCAASQKQICSVCAGIKMGPVGPTCTKICTETHHACNVCKCPCHNPNSTTHACMTKEPSKNIPKPKPN